jgi:OmpA-OmpF porin, OOP family
VSVGGHTDNVGNAASNLRLSRARAQAVATAVKAARPDLVLTVRGFGESTPVASNTDSRARSKNRRVEIRFAS